MRQRIAVVAALIFAIASGVAAAAGGPSLSEAGISQEIRVLVSARPSALVGGEIIKEREVGQIYRAVEYVPLWQMTPGSEQRASQLQTALSHVAEHGFGAEDLHLTRLGSTGGTTPMEAAARDVLLTDAFLRYASKLRQGAVASDALGPDWGISQPFFDAGGALVKAVQTGTFAELLSSLAPSDAQYRRLTGVLSLYESYAARGWPAIPGRDEVKLDGRDPRLSLVRERLRAEGDIDGASTDLAAAIRRFQQRHGLDPDGRVGQKTLAALNVSAAERAAQIAANLERWRHLPHEFGKEFVVVNAADASVDFVRAAAPRLHMRVIVGDAKHPTPVLNAQVVAVTFNPPWNVPVSIATKEILPRMKRDPRYLATNDIAIVNRPEDPFGLAIDWRRISRANFPFQLQQHPGPKNSLGLIKLEMPNRFDVYLHDTPAKALFNRPGRAFSHGCIRLERAADFAEQLLGASPDWTSEAIQEEMASGVTHRVPLAHPVPVYVLYFTAFVDDAGIVNFRNDVYGRDAPIVRALGTKSPIPSGNIPPIADIGCSGSPVRTSG